MQGRVLVIAGSDPSGGAGIQGDIKTVTALGGYAAAAVTALTVQNTLGVRSVHPVSAEVIREQIVAVLEDIGADAIKIGMLGDPAAARVVGSVLGSHAAGIPIVLDPVLVATSGDALAGEGVAGVILRELIPMATLVTPNATELAALAGQKVETVADALEAGKCLRRHAPQTAFLLKGGHLEGADVVDQLLGDDVTIFVNRRLASTSTHGTGCALAAAIASGLAQGLAVEAATRQAIDYVREAIRTAPGLGAGHGPLNHAWPYQAVRPCDN